MRQLSWVPSAPLAPATPSSLAWWISTGLIYLSVMLEWDIWRVLLPRLSINLHWDRASQLDLHLPGLADSMRLTQSNLHLCDMKTRVHTEHFQLLVREAWSKIEILVARAKFPWLDTSTPVRNVQNHYRLYNKNLGHDFKICLWCSTNFWKLYLFAVHVQLQFIVQVLTLPLQHVLGAVAEVDKLVDDTGWDQVEGRLSGL